MRPVSTNEPPPSPWASPHSDPGQGAPTGPAAPQFGQPQAPAAPQGAWPGAAGGPGGAPPQPPSAPPASSSGSGSRFGVGILVGALIGLLVGGIGGGAIGLLVGSSSDSSVTLDGGPGFSGADPDQPSTFGVNDASPPSIESSREAPVPLETTVSLGNGWDVTVDGFEPNGAELLDEDEFADPPEDGQQFVLVALSATYVDGEDESQSPFFGMDLALVGSDGVERTEFESPCSAPEPEFDRSSELYKGATASGQVCFAVGENEVDSLVLVVTPSMTFDASKSFMALT